MNGQQKRKTRWRKTNKQLENKRRKNKAGSAASYEGVYKGIGLPSIPRFGFYGSDTFPAKLLAPVTYEDTGFSLSAVVGTGYFDSHVFRGNSVYDPDQTGVGAQPYYYDTLAGVYNRYRVVKSVITVTLMATSSADTAKQIATTLFPYPVASTPDSYEYNDLKRLPKCKPVLWNQDRNDIRTLTLRNSCGTDFFSDNPLDNDWEGAVTGNPTTMWYWQLTADTVDVSTDTEIIFNCKIRYDVVWLKKASVNES